MILHLPFRERQGFVRAYRRSSFRITFVFFILFLVVLFVLVFFVFLVFWYFTKKGVRS